MESKQERPGCVWLIALYFFITAVSGFASLYAISSGFFTKLPGARAEQLAYFSTLSALDYGVSILIILFNIAGVIYLLRLKKEAVALFIAAFLLGMGLTAWQIATKNYLAVMGRPGMVGFAVGTVLILVVIGYVANLRRKGILK
jgi:hypothetical protein